MSIKVFISKLDYCFESYKSPNVHAINKRISYDMLGSIPHQKFCFYHLPTRGRAELSLGMLIRLQRIYNFWLFHVVILSFLDVLQSFYSHLYHFLVLTYWHSAKCQLFFSMFFTSQKILIKQSPNATQIYGDFLWTRRMKLGPGCTWGGTEEGTTHQGAWASLGLPPGATRAQLLPSGP